MTHKYRLVIIGQDGETLLIRRYKTLKGIQKNILVPMENIKKMLNGDILHKNYRVEKLGENGETLNYFSVNNWYYRNL
jgi:hypothetical protein